MSEVIARFMDEAGKESPRFFSDSHLQGIMQGRRDGNDTIFSYGYHFPLAEIMPSGGKRRGWWLLNGDRYRGASGWGQSTSGQQAEVRELAKKSGLPSMIVSFDALEQAGIRPNTITLTEVQEDRYTWEPEVASREPRDYEANGQSTYETRFWQQRLSDRAWICERSVHHLGEALFTAEYCYSLLVEPAYYDFSGEYRRYVPAVRENVTGTAYFLSAFDAQEGFGLYFMCQLPDGARPETVEQARECLKPESVLLAERQGIPVLRQGDVFAIEMGDVTTRSLAPAEHGRQAYVLGTSHMATEVRRVQDSFHEGAVLTYARGILRHRPAGRASDHHAVELGDRKTWFLLVKNTVPEGRAWSLSGYVD